MEGVTDAVLRRPNAVSLKATRSRWAMEQPFSPWAARIYSDRSPSAGARERTFHGWGLKHSQGTGRAAALVPTGDGGTLEVAAALGMRWRPGKVVSERSVRGLRPLNGGA